jgi:hypothetical protein
MRVACIQLKTGEDYKHNFSKLISYIHIALKKIRFNYHTSGNFIVSHLIQKLLIIHVPQIDKLNDEVQ